MWVAVIGTGYVGLVTGVGFSEMGHHVTCIDLDEAKITQLNAGHPTLYEPGLKELMLRNHREGRLCFTTSYDSVREAQVIFIAVGTPPGEDGSADLSYVVAAARSIAQALADTPEGQPVEKKYIINKSTVPVGTTKRVREAVAEIYSGPFEVVSNPEFLREGTAVGDVLEPDRIVIGVETLEAETKMRELYRPFQTTVLFMDPTSAELVKYAANAFLATEISFINLLSRLAAETGADITQVAAGMKLDRRIGRYAFLTAGPGYGGSCFPKDVQALSRTLKAHQVDTSLIDAVERVNHDQRQIVVDAAVRMLAGIDRPRVAVWGLAFKANTDDVRASPALDIAQAVAQATGAELIGYDPEAAETARQILREIKTVDAPEAALDGADILLVLTEWSEFKQPDFPAMLKLMKTPRIIDARNLYDPAEVRSYGFTYWSIGRA